MKEFIKKVFTQIDIEGKVPDFLYYTIIVLTAAAICLILGFIISKVLLRLITQLVQKSPMKWDDHMLRRKVLNRLSYLVYPLVISMFIGLFPMTAQAWIYKINEIAAILIITFTLSSLLDAVNDIYCDYRISKLRPIKGFLQAVKIILFIISGIVMISAIMNKTPLYILGGLGALTAIIILVFQTSILGFVAGVQLTTNDMVRIGDWIEMPKYDADGTVTEMSLNTVKVENFDRTITTIPTSALVNDSFKNWRGMQDSGGRRVKRSIVIDIGSIRFCTREQLDSFRNITLIKEYITDRELEIKRHNDNLGIGEDETVNGRHMTNIGVFRVYVLNYLKSHPGIRHDMITMVRQLPAQSQGLALELYTFTATTDWIEYENTQSDIFDHLFAVAPKFGLRIFQSPTGYDIKSVAESAVKDIGSEQVSD